MPEFDLMKKEISELHQRIDDRVQYSRKNCLKFSGISEPAQGKEDTDQIFLNVINKYILVGTSQQNMQRIAISNSHRLGPRPRPGTRDPPRDIIVTFVGFRDRALVYSNKRNLKSYNQNPSNSYKIFVNDASNGQKGSENVVLTISTTRNCDPECFWNFVPIYQNLHPFQHAQCRTANIDHQAKTTIFSQTGTQSIMASFQIIFETIAKLFLPLFHGTFPLLKKSVTSPTSWISRNQAVHLK